MNWVPATYLAVINLTWTLFNDVSVPERRVAMTWQGHRQLQMTYGANSALRRPRKDSCAAVYV